ncbi:MAG: hypothetical protein R2787_03105 [Saprospiraceae bacterium]
MARYSPKRRRYWRVKASEVDMARGFVSMPMVSLGVVKQHADLGIVITVLTTRHRTTVQTEVRLWRSDHPRDITAVEARIPTTIKDSWPSLDELVPSGLSHYVDLEEIYYQHVLEV